MKARRMELKARAEVSLRSCCQCSLEPSGESRQTSATPGRCPNPQPLVLKWRRHIWSGTKNINREMFTRWLEVLGLMWFLVFQWFRWSRWSPQRLFGRFRRRLNCDWGWSWMPSGSLAGSWERPSSLQLRHQTTITLVSGHAKETQGIQTHKTALHKNSRTSFPQRLK